jgi:DeoR/GlpR family transcriptional regulator of sugar metabolism
MKIGSTAADAPTLTSVSAAALPWERQELIRSRLRQSGRVLATELAAELRVSEHTIRRDLRELAVEGFCKRVYSGAVLLAPVAAEAAIRLTAASDGVKESVARAAATLVGRGQCIFLDAGSTNLAIAQALPADRVSTLVTNCPAIANVLLTRSFPEVIVIGGRLNPHAGGATGSQAVAELRRIRFDLAFVGVCAVDVEEGVTVFDAEDALFKRASIEVSNRVIAAVTTAKIGTAARHRVAAFSEINTIVVESGLDSRQLARMKRAGVEVVVARD